MNDPPAPITYLSDVALPLTLQTPDLNDPLRRIGHPIDSPRGKRGEPHFLAVVYIDDIEEVRYVRTALIEDIHAFFEVGAVSPAAAWRRGCLRLVIYRR